MTTQATPRVVTFESGGNARGAGSVDMRDLMSIKQQLDTLGRTVPGSGMYPAVGAPPAGFVDDVGSVIQKLSAVINQIIGAFNSRETEVRAEPAAHTVTPIVQTPPPSAPLPTPPQLIAEVTHYVTPRAATYARDLAQLRGLSASPKVVVAETQVVPATTPRTATRVRDLASARGEKATPKVVAAESDGAVEPKVPHVFTDEEIRRAHLALDATIASMSAGEFDEVENVCDFIVANGDEMYCISHFRNMMRERRGEDAKNFRRRFERLCKKL